MHQPFDGATGDHKALPHHLPPYLPHAIDREVLREHASNLGLEDQILTRPCRQTRWILSLRDVLIIGGWSDRQDTADRLDPIGIAVIVNESDHLGNGRSSSACAKYADALRRISWLAVVHGPRAPVPSPCPPPRSGHHHAFRCRPRPSSPTHGASAERSRSSRQSIPQSPIWTGIPARDRKTIRTARSRTSGANLFVVLLVMAPPSQELEPPTSSGRFNRGTSICAGLRSAGLVGEAVTKHGRISLRARGC